MHIQQQVCGSLLIYADTGCSSGLRALDARAGNDLNLVAGNDIIIESAQSYNSGGYKSQQWNAGIGIGASIGATGPSLGLQIEGGFGKSDSENWGIQQENSYLSAGNSINIKSDNDTTIAGAVISAPDISLDVGNNLTVQSRQDTGHAEGSSVSAGGSITIGAGVTGGVSVGFGDSDSDVAWVTEQTGIYAGDKLDIKVGNHTQLDGSVLNSDTGNLTLDTGTLGWTTIKDHDKGDAFDMTLSASTGVGRDENNNPQQVYGGSFGGMIEGHDREQDTNATVGEGNIIIRNQDQQVQDVAMLNRDLDQAQVITKDESWGVQFYGSDTSIAEALNGFQGIPQDLQNMTANTQRGIELLGPSVATVVSNLFPNGKYSTQEVSQIAEVVQAKIAGDITEDMIRSANCGSQSGSLVPRILKWLNPITTAHAYATGDSCFITGQITGKKYEIPRNSTEDCITAVQTAEKDPAVQKTASALKKIGQICILIGCLLTGEEGPKPIPIEPPTRIEQMYDPNKQKKK
ncbi:hemagglutinin repeat-containing protein [Microvirga sp. W0021]|uniref:Hemagglutinin repeat-containing protein n=1 Tax=Hohaiivirga grylli TaxID=3133970 RepID=A0ABV0BMI2_9HYPH